MCMQALRGRGAQLGNTIIASVKEAQPHGEVKKGDVASRWCGGACCHAKGRRCDGSEIKFDDMQWFSSTSREIELVPMFFGPVSHELRKKKHAKSQDSNFRRAHSLTVG
ncbi:hypothetical protein B296_00053566 [Ensete ventricosum]|uniref:Uncharacterized protein n=1 Tax=Ensete ventricosum TaxID=4639 RepID=A0A426WZ19_ENSVE|nr:hypothetical protein B296_00053566 [Ensete ventricosum]